MYVMTLNTKVLTSTVFGENWYKVNINIASFVCLIMNKNPFVYENERKRKGKIENSFL